LEFEGSSTFQRLLEYLGEQKDPVNKEKMMEELGLSKDVVESWLNLGVKKGWIELVIMVYCENCGDQVKEVKNVTEAIDKEMQCRYCGGSFVATEDHIWEYYSLTFRGIDLFNRLFKKEHFLMPQMKMLGYLSDRKLRELKDRPFHDYYVVMVLHFLRDLIPFFETLVKLGVDPQKCYLICKPYPYAYKSQVEGYLKRRGCNVNIASSFNEMPKIIRLVLGQLQQRLVSEKRSFIVIEDGGYIVPILHLEFDELIPFCKGAVEQTTKGIRRDKEIRKKRVPIRVPILNVAECEFKKKYEPRFVGDAVVMNIRNMLPDKNFEGQYALVIGFGTIGSKIAERLSAILRMKSYVVDPRPGALLEASGLQYIAKAQQDPQGLIEESILVIGATGRKYAIGKREISLLKHNAILVSASSDRDEIDVKELELLAGDKGNMQEVFSMRDEQKIGTRYTLARLNSRSVLLLADGYPVNFYGSESVPNESFDPILTMLFISALELVTRQRIRPGIHTKIVNDLVTREGVEKEVLRIYRSIVIS